MTYGLVEFFVLRLISGYCLKSLILWLVQKNYETMEGFMAFSVRPVIGSIHQVSNVLSRNWSTKCFSSSISSQNDFSTHRVEQVVSSKLNTVANSNCSGFYAKEHGVREYARITPQIIKRHYATNKGPPTNKIVVSGWFNNINLGTIVKVGGGGVLLLLIASIGGYLYCEKETDHELCESLRGKLGLKKN